MSCYHWSNFKIKRKCLLWRPCSGSPCCIKPPSVFSPSNWTKIKIPFEVVHWNLLAYATMLEHSVGQIYDFVSCWRVDPSKVLGYCHSELLSCLPCTLLRLFLMVLFYCCYKECFASACLLVHSVASLWLRVIEGSTCPRRPLPSTWLQHLPHPHMHNKACMTIERGTWSTSTRWKAC